MKYAVLLTAVGLLLSSASAQTSWWRTYGGAGDDWGHSVQQTADDGYIVAGFRASSNVYLIKTSASGGTLWTRTYGGPDQDWGTSVRQTADGGYVIAGATYSFGVGSPMSCNVYLIRTNASGDTLWTRTYGGGEGDVGYSVQQTTDNGYVIAGMKQSSDMTNVYLTKTDAAGDALWTRTYGGTTNDEGYSVRETTDGGYIIAGMTQSFGVGSYDVWLIKTNAQGDTLWTRTYGGSNADAGKSVQQTVDGGYVIAGVTYSFGAGGADIYLIKTNSSGDTLWTRTYGGTGSEEGRSAQQTRDGGYTIAGSTVSFGAGARDAYLVKTNAQGDTLWTRTYGGTGNEEGRSVQQTTDGGCVIAGYASSFGAGSEDVYLIKTDSLGNVGVVEESPRAPVPILEQASTVLSGASGVRRLASCVVFDAMGRRVVNPRSGIYFVREEPQAASHKPQTVRKVVLQR